MVLNNNTFLLDSEFLRLLDLEREKEVFVKIISLDFDENALEAIEGRVTQGSISIDGTSSVRRTCSLSLEASELNIHEFYWGLNTKFRLFTGLKNTVKMRNPYKEKYKHYPDICWFNMGTYIISSFDTSQSLNQYNISIQGRDKMCLLNGDVGGIITPLSWDFGKIDEIQSDGTIIHNDYLLRDIITEAVHQHAQEPFWNIIINDLDDYGLELLEYRGDVPLYLVYDLEQNVINQGFVENPNNDILTNRFINQGQPKNVDSHGNYTIAVNNKNQIIFDYRISKLEGEFGKPTRFTFTDTNGQERHYTIIKTEYGDVVGYRTTDLTYPGDLIANVGESVTSVLDKIVNMLGDFEYFYDVDGHFIFQRKKTYIKSVFTPEEDNDESGNEIYIENLANTSACTYSFENAMLVSSFSNNPDYANIKNDFSIWGVRSGISGVEIPIHLRYAIDTKPWYYKNFQGQVYVSKEGEKRYKKLIDNYNQELRTSAKTGGNVYIRKKVPAYLYDETGYTDWWNLLDWAEYYHSITGSYPDQHRMRDYKDSSIGYQGGISEPFMMPNGEILAKGTYIIDTDPTTGLLYHGEGGFCKTILQTDANGVERIVADTTSELIHQTSWNPTMHSGLSDQWGMIDCNHAYCQFIYLNTHYPVTTLIYHPQIPANIIDEEIAQRIEELIIDPEETMAGIKVCDWRELIYQMSLDYNKHNHDEDFLIQIDKNNTLFDGSHLYLEGKTKYEQYYIDINGFWRDLYNPDYQFSLQVAAPQEGVFNSKKNEYYIYQNCEGLTYNEVLAAMALWKQNGGDGLFYHANYRGYMVSMSNAPTQAEYESAPSDYYFIRHCGRINGQTASYAQELAYNLRETYYTRNTDDYNTETHWVSTLVDNPEGLNFWFDFLDTEGDLDKYKVREIGDRTKAENDTNIKSIYFRDVPTVIFVGQDTDIATEKAKRGTGYTYIQVPSYIENLFSMSTQWKSAMDVLNEWIYSYAYCAESISFNTLPIYYLQPNTRVFIRDDNSGINGEYIITRLNIPLGYSGTMSISATKAVENLY